MPDVNSILSGWVAASQFNDAAVFAFGSKAKVDRCITHLAASAIKLALDEMLAGHSGTSVEANILIYQALVYIKKDASLLRSYFMNFGPFVAAKTDVSVEVGGKKVVIEKNKAVRFSERVFNDKFKERTPEEYALEADAVNFATWRAAAKAENEATKTEEEQAAEEKKKLQLRLDRVVKAAKESNVELDWPWPKTETIKVRSALSFDSVLETIKAASQSDKLSDEQRIILDDMLVLAAKMIAANK